ncbi:MAG: hypothetical protein A3C90_00450 [Candidatus Magasanikbacteria bacterium RIFCSPHIGHO2_02_FULL_51_14]|uniref:Uncharacterized protein n=1 Tax=Candidatus Magasanikbacteria bacterium RIFCSPHIGHO2_02_FULL_51_14 TaxID=1798683 RepID=A0A1F6ME72_9BACT|nr:MAG: hypothetical protein A3C90_00450 [Candidatus Magasanikbacteria bacterium RIFCSPHIGHO2_02_FULL_51_14]
MNKDKRQLFFGLLEKSSVFDDRAKLVIRRAVEEDTLPTIDFDYLTDVMKLEQNMYTVIDKRASALLDDLKKKYTAVS